VCFQLQLSEVTRGRKVAAAVDEERRGQTLVERLFAAGEIHSSLSLAAATMGMAVVTAAIFADPSQAAEVARDPSFHPVAANVGQIAAEEDLLSNLAKYARFAISLSTGTVYVILKPFAGLLKKPVTAVLLVVGVVGFIFFLNFTINAMLGITDPVEYKFSPIE